MIFLAALTLAGAIAAPPANMLSDDVWWVPATPAMAERVERIMATRTLPHPFAEAERHYRTFEHDGRREIIGQYRWFNGAMPGVLIDDGSKGATVVSDGGCGVYNPWYDWDKGQVIQAGCGGR